MFQHVIIFRLVILNVCIIQCFAGISIEEQESVIKMMNEEIRQLNESQMTSRLNNFDL